MILLLDVQTEGSKENQLFLFRKQAIASATLCHVGSQRCGGKRVDYNKGRSAWPNGARACREVGQGGYAALEISLQRHGHAGLRVFGLTFLLCRRETS
ncbi:hypothetical protein B0F90DRAFT_706852 [Multifurca ochricompacta]|uniref:Uncharacterized protein n=1 Tax=Multifurca ochricompacta TaxID=376703 RepID=A0AAD4LSV2_9AGAM|nr:hypothetical protein B0F90DRAFT_706852 [Multifurca ochricompacta]